jgi:hypothetical protein
VSTSPLAGLAALVAATTLTLAPRRARAETPDATSLLDATAYILPVGCSAVTGTYHLTYIMYGEGAPRRWRTAAYICGGVSIGLGAYVLATGDEQSGTGLTIGILPIVIGSYAIATAWFVGAPDDVVGPMARAPRVTPWVAAGAAGIAWSGRF